MLYKDGRAFRENNNSLKLKSQNEKNKVEISQKVGQEIIKQKIEEKKIRQWN